LKAIKRLVDADALKMEIIPNPKVLRSTDTARRIRRYENGDTGYGDFKKQ
jgi:hypothetical protein